MKKTVKHAIIIGPDEKNVFQDIIQSVQKLCAKNSCLVIGDGQKPIDSEEDLLPLHYLTDSQTKIHILAHGSMCMDNSHCIQVSKDYIHLTYKFIENIQVITGKKPLQIHLYSCYGGLAQNEVSSILEHHSFFITYASDNKPLIAAFAKYVIDNEIKTNENNPFQGFMNNLLIASIKKLPFLSKQKNSIHLLLV